MVSTLKKPQSESSETQKQQEARESVTKETRSALGGLNTDVFSWLKENIGRVGAQLSTTISGLLGGLGTKIQDFFAGFGLKKSADSALAAKPLENKDILAETGSFLKRLPVDPENIAKKLDPQSFFQRRVRGGKVGQHNSIDIAVPVGKPVYAGFDATVSRIVPVTTGTNSIVFLQDGSGNLTVKYIHLSRIDVSVGQRVKADTIVGLSGGAPGAPGAGSSQGPHVHMEILHKGQHLNPYAHLAGCKDCPPALKAA